MNQPLDSILRGGEAAPEQDQVKDEQVTQANEAEGQQADQQQEPAEGQQQQGDDGQKVPMAALHAEKQKVKRYTEEVAEFRRTNEALQRQVGELLQRVPVPKQEQPQPPDWFENPQAATRHELTQAVSPEFDRINQTLQAFARDFANRSYDEATVNNAEQAFLAAMQSGKLDPSDYQRVVNSPNRFAEAVKWHKRQQAQAEIGDDPAAFRAKVEAEIRAKLEAELNGNGQQQAQQRTQQVTPSNLAGARNVGSRTGPAWSGPTPIADIFAR